MTFWFWLALMTAAAVAAVVWPLRRRSIPVVVASKSDAAVYRDQLDEIERDRASGLIGAAEAEAARVEISRRLIAAVDNEPAAQFIVRNRAATRRHRLAIAGAVIAVSAGVVGLYLAVGSPNLPDQPLADRIAAAHGGDRSIETLFAKVEAHLEQHPDDGRGWEAIAPAYMRLGRYDDAVKARANALRLLGATAERHADLGEALVAAANGVVTAEAKAAFDEAIRLDGSDVTARFYEGLAAEQDGRREEAARVWHALLSEAPDGAQWVGFVRRALARVDPSVADARTPGTEATVFADAMPDQDQDQDNMIRGMVERLAARLRQDGSDPDGWIKLVRSYKVLGEAERARTAIADARRALASEPEKLARLDEGLKDLDRSATAAAPESASSRENTNSSAGHDQTMRNLVERLAARLRQDGSDVDGWIMLARSYRALGEPEQARAAVADARRALAHDPDKLSRLDETAKGLDLTSTTTADVPVSGGNDARPSATSTPGQDQMIRGMVDRLAARLNRDGSDAEGWVRLVRSYKVLGELERMRAAITAARRALANDEDKLRKFDNEVKSLGIEG
jgi:cytochrome c-type biogenesis protein CcmH